LAAQYNPRPGTADETARFFPQAPRREALTPRAFVDAHLVHAPDVDAEDLEPSTREFYRRIGLRAVLAVPMIHEGRPIGVVSVSRGSLGPFSDRQIELLKTFADQAVIAIENVRLFNETKEALEQQTATSEILRVISSSPTDVQPVFDAIAAAATTLCAAENAGVFLFDGTLIHFAAHHHWTDKDLAVVRETFPRPPGPGTGSARAILTRGVVHLTDSAAAPGYDLRSLSFRTILSVPMLRAGDPIGAISVNRREAIPFTDKQITLLQTFADQAVIAIENVRLFKELGERNAELAETLARQTATGEVLRAISRAQTDAQPVFDIIAESAQRLCGAGYGQVALYDGELLHMTAFHNISLEGVEALRRRFPARADRGSAMGRAIQTRTVVQIPDVLEDPGFAFKSELTTMGSRSILAAPMLRDGEPIGAIGVGRPEPGPFPNTQIALLQTFADQAVIAIENVRLFKELQSSNRDLTTALDKQTATSDILRVISQSQTDVQ